MSFKAFCFCLFLLVGAVFFYIKFELGGSIHSSFNQTTRFSLGRYSFMRTLFSLHNAGDARAEYFKVAPSIIIELAVVPGADVQESVINDFAAKVSKVTGKDAKIFTVQPIPAGTMQDADLAAIVRTGKRDFEPGSPILFIMVTNDFSSTSTAVAKTYQEFGIVLSTNKLHAATENYPSAFGPYEETALLHEFGRQMGLSENDRTECIMNTSVENPSTAISASSPTDFCSFEQDQLNNLKAQFQ
jgi:hypothetical protein